MCGLHANSMQFHIGDLSIDRFWYLRGSSSPQNPGNNCLYKNDKCGNCLVERAPREGEYSVEVVGFAWSGAQTFLKK
jgi:hypothetical protein